MFSSYTTPNSTAGPVENWQRFGDRTDWKAVWSDGGTMLGLTADGTVWIWGIDLTASADTGLKMRLTRLEEILDGTFGRIPRGRPNAGLPPLQIEPRPLIKFVREP